MPFCVLAQEMIYLLGKKIKGPPVLDSIATFYSFTRADRRKNRKTKTAFSR